MQSAVPYGDGSLMDWVWEWARAQGALVVVLCMCIYGLIYALRAVIDGRVVPKWTYDASEKREESWHVLYEREKATSERLLEQAERERRAP